MKQLIAPNLIEAMVGCSDVTKRPVIFNLDDIRQIEICDNGDMDVVVHTGYRHPFTKQEGTEVIKAWVRWERVKCNVVIRSHANCVGPGKGTN